MTDTTDAVTEERPSAPSPSPSATARADARRFAWAAAAGGLLAFVVLVGLATRGYSTLFDQPHLGGFFDAQAHALLHGHWDVGPNDAAFERFRIDGRYYMYFGPTPALFRMPLLVFTGSLDGRLGRVSMIAASAVLVWAIARLTWLARRSVRDGRPVPRGEAVIVGALVFAASLGTAAVYIASWTAVYHEAIMWAVALALVSYGALLAWMLDARGRDLAIAGAAATLSVLARGSVGLGPVAAIGIVLVVRLFRAYRTRGGGETGDGRALGRRRVDRRTIAWLGAACAVPIVLYAYVNQVKFGSPFSTPPVQYQDQLIDWPPRVAAMAANGGKLTGIKYAPTTLYHFFRPDGLAFDRLFPWVLPLVPHKVFGSVVFENFRPTASLTSTTPLALIAAVLGTWVAVARRALRRWLAPIAGALVGSLGVFVFAWLDHRYQADFAPLLIIPGLLGAWVVVDWLGGRPRALVVGVTAVVVLLGAWGVWANVGLAVVYQRTQPDWSTVDDRASLVEAQLRVADALGTPLASWVRTGDALPSDGQMGELFVLGDCAGVFRFDGTNWLAAEQTSPTGYDRLRVSLADDASGRQPVLTRTDDLGTTVIWARGVPGRRVAFEHEWVPAAGVEGSSSRLDLGTAARAADGSVDLSVRFDRRPDIAHFLQLRANGRLLYDDHVTATYGPTVLGAQDVAAGATSFDGTVRDLGTPTPLCDRLVDAGVHLAAVVSDARRFHRASLAGGAVALFVLAWLATRGFSTLFDRPPLANFYDAAQARALFHGRWNMPANVLTFERFNVGGRYYTYFGPTPAFLRMPLLVLSDWFDGRLSRVSTIAACFAIVWAVARLSWLARRTVRGDRPVSRVETFVAGGLVVVASLGTVTPYLAGWTQVYHEAIIWGAAFALVSYGALVAWMLDARTRDLVVAGVAAVLSVLARGSVGFGPIAALGLVAVVRGVGALRARRAGQDVDWALLGGLAAVVLVPILAYGYVNHAKFGAWFGAPPFAEQDLLVRLRPSRAEAMADNGGSLFGIRYAPTILYHYLRPDGVTLDGLFPWVQAKVPTRVFGGAVFEALLPTTSITAASPLALLAALLGGVTAIVRRGLRTVWLAPVAGVAIGAIGAVSLAFVDLRYQGDFVPLLVVPGVVGAWVLVEWLAARSRTTVVTVVVLAVLLGAWSVWVNVAEAYQYQHTQTPYSTVDDRAALVETQLRVRQLLGGGLPSQVGAGDELPATGAPGDLFVLGDCAGVYRSDGTSWLPVEQTSTTGFYDTRLRLDREAQGRQPVLSSVDDTGTTVIWARNQPGGRVGVEYQWEAADPGDDASTRIPLGTVDRDADGTVGLTVRVDPRAGISDMLQVRADGHLLYQDVVNKLHGPVELGVQDALPGATSLAGQVRLRPADTPICDRLVDLGVRPS